MNNKDFVKKMKKFNERDQIETIKKNTQLPLHEIKKILKKRYPEITNEEVETLLVKITRRAVQEPEQEPEHNQEDNGR